MSKSPIKSWGDLLSRIDWIKVLIFLSVIITVFVIFSCSEVEPTKVAVGCECNDGVKLDFSKSILPGTFDSIKFEPKHCDGGRYSTTGTILILLDHEGFKEFIYNKTEL